MSIAEAVRAAITPKVCKFAGVLNSIPEDDAVIIRNGFLAGLTATEAARILTKNGHPVSATVAKEHTSGVCCCKDAA